VPQDVDTGLKIHLIIRWNYAILIIKEYDLCDSVGPVNLSCPLREHCLNITHSGGDTNRSACRQYMRQMIRTRSNMQKISHVWREVLFFEFALLTFQLKVSHSSSQSENIRYSRGILFISTQSASNSGLTNVSTFEHLHSLTHPFAQSELRADVAFKKMGMFLAIAKDCFPQLYIIV